MKPQFYRGGGGGGPFRAFDPVPGVDSVPSPIPIEVDPVLVNDATDPVQKVDPVGEALVADLVPETGEVARRQQERRRG